VDHLGVEWLKKEENKRRKMFLPPPYRQFFQIHGSEFKPDPVGNSGQASMVGIAHP